MFMTFTFEIGWQKELFCGPWRDGNPKASMRTSDIKEADFVCVTHDHVGHVGSGLEICKHAEATFAGTPELYNYARENGVKEVVGFNVGGYYIMDSRKQWRRLGRLTQKL